MLLLPSTKSSHNIQIDGFQRPAVEPTELPELLVRNARASDEARIRQLARLDDRRLPEGPYLVAELGGQMVAALSMPAGVVVADPFRRTADATDMLRMRARQIAARERQVAERASRSALRPVAA